MAIIGERNKSLDMTNNKKLTLLDFLVTLLVFSWFASIFFLLASTDPESPIYGVEARFYSCLVFSFASFSIYEMDKKL